jgi:hypothetical protein
MAVLGNAIARYLSKLGGLYSVELPESLIQEMVDLVQAANAVTVKRALLVTDDPAVSASVATTTWRDILGWRTTDDRAFVWKRGFKQPDTSFLSVVRPFISTRFPGADGGECTLELLVRISISELWYRRGKQPIGDVFDAFYRTGLWVTGLLRYTFERAGSTPSLHWSDRFLEHLAGMLIVLDQILQSYPNELEPQHAWEIVRVSGLPLPSSIAVGNPFLKEPAELPEKEWKSLADIWQDAVQSFILPEGNLAFLLTALDRQVLGAVKVSPWRGLSWGNVQGMPLDIAPPVVGSRVFAEPPSPSLVSPVTPAFPIAPTPSWWGVTSNNLGEALRSLRAQTALVPDPNCTGILRLVAADPSPFVLNTRSGALTHAHTNKKWRARILVNDVVLTFKEEWTNLSVSIVEPQNATEGDAWINPDSIQVRARGIKTESQLANTTPGGQLTITASLSVEYFANKDDAGNLSGTWNPNRSLSVGMRVRRYSDGQWDLGRQIESDINLIAPSPFASTVMVMDANRPVAVAPDQDDFQATIDSAAIWVPEATPTILLREEGPYDVCIYDGTLQPNQSSFADISQPSVGPTALGVSQSPMFTISNCDLDDGVLVSDATSGRVPDMAVFKVKERSPNLSSSLLSAVRGLPAGRKAPSNQAAQSVLGKYQQKIARALCNKPTPRSNSLYQYVISSSDVYASWPEHPGTPEPLLMFSTPSGFLLPGIGTGPSGSVTNSSAWQTFTLALDDICTALGLVPGKEDIWLSGIDLGRLSIASVRKYVLAHRELIKFARQLGAVDLFWSSYPLSVIVVEGTAGINFGQLRAVLLSPLHPARLAWSFAVTLIARNSKADKELLGLLEGWNIPCTGAAVNPAGQYRQLVAVPTDPGPEQDFVTWSALAVLNEAGLAELPVFGAGQPLPWGGRTGINARVVERALVDYLAVHPHINSLQLDIRSVSPAPRSQEIDDAVLTLVGGTELNEIERLGGGTTVWDSGDRRGPTPTRDKLFSIRGETDKKHAFEWKIYPPTQPPLDTDIALVENASVHLAVTSGEAYGVLGPLPLRRFAPSSLQNLTLDQHFFVSEGEDFLGLSDLLRQLEAPPNSDSALLRATPLVQALGIGLGAKWEVLGTFNLDPALLSAVVSQSAGTRLLWEWRPSWMPFERKESDLARRPYYVIARVPTSLLKALQSRQGFDPVQAAEMLRVLGSRGIGLAALNAHGGTQESAAAGFFYSLQTFLPPPTYTAPQFTSTGDLVGLMPIDPLESILEGLAGKKFERRADLLAIALRRLPEGRLKLCFVPVEVKHHGMPSQPETIPEPSDSELKRARQQLVQTAHMMAAIRSSLSAQADTAGTYLKRVGLATLLDLAMSFSPTPPTPLERSEVLKYALSGELQIGVGDPILMWFAPGSVQSSGAPCVIDRYGPTTLDGMRVREIYIDPITVPGLWWTASPIGPNELQVRGQISGTIQSAFAACTAEGSFIGDLRADLRSSFGFPDEDHLHQTPEDNVSRPTERPTSPARPAEPTQRDDAQIPELQTPTTTEPPSNQPTESDRSAGIATPLELPDAPIVTPQAFIGWSAPATRWAVIGKLANSEETVALDLDHPKTLGIFGYMGSGKSYLLGDLIESAVLPIKGINVLPLPLAVVVFNYRRNASDRFELASLSLANQDPRDIDALSRDYHASPTALPDVHVLCLPGELRPERLQEYGSLHATELFFDPTTIGIEDWELLMGEPGSEAVFARTIRNTLVDLRAAGDITFDNLEQQVLGRLGGQSRTAARLRFDFVRRYISEDRGVDFENLLRPGRVLIVDLRQPLFNKDDALRFFLVCANQISRVQGRFNKMLLFDEAHEYMSEAFSERMEARIRLMRHEGTSYVFASQDVRSIPVGISRFLSSRFVFDLGTRENLQDLQQVAPEFQGFQLTGIQPGHCYVQGSISMGNLFNRPREIRVRPRVTQHGGRSQIFTVDNE